MAEGAGAWGWEAGGREAWAGEVESPRLYMAVSMSGTSRLLEGRGVGLTCIVCAIFSAFWAAAISSMRAMDNPGVMGAVAVV